jgi:2-polyprenyl-6-methoxyphenol hydroxylase-like FAD-dependent oxidoreductase
LIIHTAMGVVLIGDAAAANDPTFGCGLSLALPALLRDQLLTRRDWSEAAHAYAVEHDRYYAAIRRLTTCTRTLFYDLSPEARAARARALPRIVANPKIRPDIVGVGPEFPSDEQSWQRLFGEDEHVLA